MAQNMYTIQSVTQTHTDSIFFKEQSYTYPVQLLPFMFTAELCVSLMALLLVASGLGPSLAVLTFFANGNRQRSWGFAGTSKSLAGLFTFLSRRPNVSQLRTNGRNWFRTIVTILK